MLGASLNGPTLWMPDWFEVEVGVEREFNGIKAPWVAQLNMGSNVNIDELTPYKPSTIAPKGDVGSTVLLLDGAEGNTWVMKGLQLALKPRRTQENLLRQGPPISRCSRRDGGSG